MNAELSQEFKRAVPPEHSFRARTHPEDRHRDPTRLCRNPVGAGARVVHEQWLAPLGSTMMRMSRTVVRDTTRDYEHLRIESGPSGAVTHTANPSGQPEARFAGDVVSDTLVVFANPAHDSPRRIMYRPVGRDSLVARIEGMRNGQLRGNNFPMRRVGCGVP